MRKQMHWTGGLIALLCVAASTFATIPFAWAETAPQAKADPAVERAQRQAKMLDTLYKSAIVLITENYVTGDESLTAGDAFQAYSKR